MLQKKYKNMRTVFDSNYYQKHICFFYYSLLISTVSVPQLPNTVRHASGWCANFPNTRTIHGTQIIMVTIGVTVTIYITIALIAVGYHFIARYRIEN